MDTIVDLCSDSDSEPAVSNVRASIDLCSDSDEEPPAAPKRAPAPAAPKRAPAPAADAAPREKAKQYHAEVN